MPQRVLSSITIDEVPCYIDEWVDVSRWFQVQKMKDHSSWTRQRWLKGQNTKDNCILFWKVPFSRCHCQHCVLLYLVNKERPHKKKRKDRVCGSTSTRVKMKELPGNFSIPAKYTSYLLWQIEYHRILLFLFPTHPYSSL